MVRVNDLVGNSATGAARAEVRRRRRVRGLSVILILIWGIEQYCGC
jgi:hypothetical protein